MPGREDYEERRQARIDRMNSASSRLASEAIAASMHSHDLLKDIPLGQPNIHGALTGLMNKAHRAADRAVTSRDKSDYYAEKAEAAESNRAISSDDPNALDKLQDKLSALEAERDRVKAANKEAKKAGREQAPWYTLPYLARDIKAVKERIAKLQLVDSMPAELIEFDGGEIESDPVTNRVIIRFDGRQPESVTDSLRSYGFRWAPSAQGWQRLRSPQALKIAKSLCHE